MSIWNNILEEDIEKLKKWAHENYCPGDKIHPLWPHVVREECAGMNQFMVDNYTPKMVTVETVQREAKAFMEMVSEMRGAQRQYFETRDVKVLKLSKSLEKQVDQAIDKQLKNDNQTEMFKTETKSNSSCHHRFSKFDGDNWVCTVCGKVDDKH